MGGQLDVGVLEPDDEADRDVLLAHRIDERAAELAVLWPACGAASPIVWTILWSGAATFQTSFTPSAQICGLLPFEAEAIDRRGREVAGGAFSEDGDPRRHVDAGLEVRERLAVAPTTLVARAHADDAAVVDEEPLAGGLREDHHARCLRLLGEEPAELRDGDDPVAVVHHRRRRRDPQRRALREEVDGLAVHRPVGRHLLDAGSGPRTASGSRAGSSRRPRAGASRAACPSRAPRPARHRAARASRDAPRAAARGARRTRGRRGRLRRSGSRRRCARRARRSARRSPRRS